MTVSRLVPQVATAALALDYAGGILSAAVDGIKEAEDLAQRVVGRSLA